MAGKSDPRFTGDVQRLIGEKAKYTGETYEAAAQEILDYMNETGDGLTAALDAFIAKRRTKHEAGVKEVQIRYRVTTFQVPPVVMETAMMLADGDISRLAIQEDGSIIVLNESRRPE